MQQGSGCGFGRSVKGSGLQLRPGRRHRRGRARHRRRLTVAGQPRDLIHQ